MKRMKRTQMLRQFAVLFAAIASAHQAWAAPLPTVTIVATDAAAAEAGRDPAVFTISRSGAATTQALAVGYSVTGTAVNGTDYDRLTGIVSIPAGQASATISLRPLDDTTAEATETAILTISTSNAYTVGSARTATANIVDNDTTVTIGSSDPSAAETGRDPAVFTVSRSGSAAAALTVAYTVSGSAASGGDYVALSGNVTIAAGQTSASIAVTPIDDTAAELEETVILTLSPRPQYVVGSQNAATARIADNDTRTVLPVLMVIANVDFYYREYSETRASLVLAGIPVRVAAAQRIQSTPHPNSGQGADSGVVMPDMELGGVNPADYSAIVFVGGWGASSYQYAFSGTYANASYNGTAATKTRANQLIKDFQSQGKYVTAICHGVSVLAWARVNNQSPLRGHRVAGYHGAAPQSTVAGATTSEWSVQQNGAQMFPSGSLGNPGTVVDDVYVDGKIITAENFDTATRFGQVLAQQLLK
jgi:putative intracellular protease/amidase